MIQVELFGFLRLDVVKILSVNIEQFVQRVEVLHQHLANLSETARVLPWIPSHLLPQAFQELYNTSKTVQLEAREIYQQNKELIQTSNLIETACRYYQNLFDFAPDAYLVTNPEGIIQAANLAAARLLNIAQDCLVGESILNFIPPAESPKFTHELIQISHSPEIREILLLLQERHGKFFPASVTVTVVQNHGEKSPTLHWLLHDISEHQPEDFSGNQSQQELVHNRPVHKYSKGETIPLNPVIIWYVRRGLVKLSTFCETGEELLIGLATEEMIFGSSMTSLSIYQAIAQSDVELSSIDLGEIRFFPTLSQTLLSKIQQRLHQTESFLVISGRRRVQERLYHLLELLKQQVGQKVPEGIRLTVRFTHEDIASACSTTRVTITRLIGKLQAQGVISFDQKKHIIFRNST